MGPPSGFSLRVMGRGMLTNSVRISSADKRTLAYPVSSEIDELEVRSQIRVGERPGALEKNLEGALAALGAAPDAAEKTAR
jgi:hypothetical protein